MLCEKDLRGPEFSTVNSAPVTMADGQVWWLAKPFVDFNLKTVDGTRGIVSETTFGPEFDAKVAALEGSAGSAFFLAVGEIGIDLLRRNYTLSEEECYPLLRFRANDPESQARLEAIIATANGSDAPKPSPAGSDAPS